MPKPTKYAALICAILMVVAIIGMLIGFWKHSPLVVVLFLLPTVIYEVYRTEGKSTKWASWVLLAIFVLEILFIGFNINFDLGAFLGRAETAVAGYEVPLGDIKIVSPVLIAILSILLFVRTYGIYTKWLAAIIIVGSFVIVYLLDPMIFQKFLKIGVDQGLDKFLQQIQ